MGHYKNINESYNKLLNYINKSGMSIGNEAIEILLITSNIIVKHEEWRTQIQIPVKIKNRD
ncbi:GyrI-like domain-containing protein [Abyssisolibacter fermentans]|uniref:GyrI-like domain-containing protein n=1 Tax=Abyssisolibacter fermentans TaxID=1766203 RepID=UPI0023DE0C18|nr:GyrI-like domain-containing protein [Abyssisolibacter fermentans]